MEDNLTNTPRPEVVEGSHRALLRQRLMQDMRRKEHVQMARSMGWKRKVGWACLLALGALGVAWGSTVLRSYVVRGEVTPVIVQGKNGPVTYSVSRGGTYVASSQEEAEAMHKAIEEAFAEGRYEFVKTIQGDLGPLSIYRVTLRDGSTIETNYDIMARRDPAADLQEMQDQFDRGEGELVGVFYCGGRVFYDYRYTLSDGRVQTATHDPGYLGIEEAVCEELEQLIAEGQWELKWGPPESAGGQYCYKFILSNGKPMRYITDKPLDAE
jgi:hypothetical protein